MTRKSPLRATNPHICIIGHITGAELQAELNNTNAINDLANRFLFCCARRSKFLPFGGSPEPAILEDLRRRLQRTCDTAPRGEIGLDIVARELWADAYPEIGRDRYGFLGALTNRAAPQIMRVALIYALLDGSRLIGEAHLKAGIEIWRYAEASARYALRERTGGQISDTILANLLDAGSAGLAKTQIHALLGRNSNAASINAALRLLQESGLATQRFEKGTGRPTEIWVAL